jgi:hypothetical protein
VTESVVIPRDLFEKMADAVSELRTVYDEDDDGRELKHAAEYTRIAKLADEIEENWPEESFSGEYPTPGSGHKFVRQTKLSGSNQPR